MLSKKMLRYAVSVLVFVFVISLCIGLPGAIAEDEPAPCDVTKEDCLFGCTDDFDFTMDFRLEDCKFMDKGINPFFILKPGYQLVLESEDEKCVETVLCDTKWINLDGRRIKTRVVEERAYEDDKLIEISRNYFAICKKTNAVYYFGEASRDCDPESGGFNPNDESLCANGDEPDPAGSWEAGKQPMNDPDDVIAKPGLIMPGTPLQGARYFQEKAPPAAVDRGEIAASGLSWPPEEDLDEGEEPDFTGCINIIDTNPAEGACGNEDSKIYCPKVGLVQDQELELVWYGFVGCNGGVDDDDNDNDDDDFKHKKKWR
jgi:hypothetical protein